MCVYYLMLYIMNNVNTLNDADINQKKSSGLSRLSQVLALCTILSITNPAEVKANNITDEGLQNVEVVQGSDIVSNIQNRTWVSLPSMYTQKFRNFVSSSRILKDKDAMKFTEDFIVKQIQSNRWISKQNQLLFIWDAIYEQITSKNIYTWEDGNSARLSEFENVMDRVEQCWKNYNSWFKAYMRQQSANADRRSADADRRSADADRRSADADRRSADADREIIKITNNRLNQLVEFYNLYKKNPNNIKSEEILQMKNSAKRISQNCKNYNINYKTKLSPEVRKFYGID